MEWAVDSVMIWDMKHALLTECIKENTVFTNKIQTGCADTHELRMRLLRVVKPVNIWIFAGKLFSLVLVRFFIWFGVVEK